MPLAHKALAHPNGQGFTTPGLEAGRAVQRDGTGIAFGHGELHQGDVGERAGMGQNGIHELAPQTLGELTSSSRDFH